ncbi:MAG: hypothetical protein HW375_2358, partial [Anaerolineales bacterium]|nr:hypothetical protein [Anaerolineales bacterium]
MLSTPGISSIQLTTSTSRTMVATHGKMRLARFPAVDSVRLKRT